MPPPHREGVSRFRSHAERYADSCELVAISLAPNRAVRKHGDIRQNAFGFDQNDASSVHIGMFEGRDQDAMNFDGLAMAGE